MKIYFAGSIRAGREDVLLYQSIIDELSCFGEVLTFHVGDPSLTEKGDDGSNDRFIYDRDMAWLSACDVLVAEVTSPSLGVGYELGCAVALKKPVLCLYRPVSTRPLSAMVAGNPHIQVVEYTSIEEARNMITRFMEECRPPRRPSGAHPNGVSLYARQLRARKDSVTVSLELLAPAGNAEIGIAAIDHGADAVYIGAPKFSARANAGVHSDEIRRLIHHAHLFYARVYVALNTILTDEEISDARDIIREIYEFGADGLIIQDRGLLELDLPPIPLIASTQMHNDTPEKIRFLEAIGFKRVILARELSLDDIAAIRQQTRIELEVFVHGALCVSCSGQCYMSQAVAGRSGNRGVCAQPCRSRYTLTDGDGKRILEDKFLLSLKDLNLTNDLPALAAAGVTSFKIEGRYKDIDYVKNVTAAYSQALDQFIISHPGYHRSSSGRSELLFAPDPAKSFNRGFTRYFISGEKEKVASLDTQKSIGQSIGTVTGVGKGFIQTDCANLQNGDGLCFFTKERELAGFRIERMEGKKAYPNSMKDIAKGIALYRNQDTAMSRILKKVSSRRQLSAEMEFLHAGDSVRLAARDEDGNCVELMFDAPYVEPKDLAKAREQIEKQISSTGNTVFKVVQVTISGRIGFLPLSLLNTMKRNVLAELARIRLENFPRITAEFKPGSVPYPEKRLDFRANVFNQSARRFYERHGAEVAESAFETLSDPFGKEVMKTRYCLLYQLDACLLSGQSRRQLKAPLHISDSHHIYRLQFDCEQCRMSVILERRK